MLWNETGFFLQPDGRSSGATGARDTLDVLAMAEAVTVPPMILGSEEEEVNSSLLAALLPNTNPTSKPDWGLGEEKGGYDISSFKLLLPEEETRRNMKYTYLEIYLLKNPNTNPP